MNVLIVEDEMPAVDRLRKMLLEVDAQARVVGVTNSIVTAVEWLETNLPPQLILMDIELADGQCFEIFKRTHVSSPVIFTTSYDEYALQAFKVNSIDYLLKPVKKEELRAGLAKYRRLTQSEPVVTEAPAAQIEGLLRQLAANQKTYRERFLIKWGQRYISLEADDIAYFYHEDRLTHLRTWKNERYLIEYSLDELEEMLLPRQFFRANRKFILHIKSIKSMHAYFHHKLKLTLQPPVEEEVLISREKAADFKTWMGK